MSNELVSLILFTTSLCPIVASFVAFQYRLFKREESPILDANGNDNARYSSLSLGSVTGFMKFDMISLLLFQALLIVIGLKSIIISYTHIQVEYVLRSLQFRRQAQ